MEHKDAMGRPFNTEAQREELNIELKNIYLF
jgi:hypothetical protein